MLTILVRGAVVSVCLLLAGGSVTGWAQQEQGTQPRLIPVTPEGEAPRRKEMRPVADEPEPPPKPKIIRVRTPKAQPAPANETPAAASAATPGESVPEIQPAPQIIRVPAARAKRAAPPAETKEEASSQPTDAKEDYEFCNRTSFSVNVALGLRDQAQWRTRGWWTIYPGDCKSIIKGKLMATPHYTFAKTHFIHRGPTRVWGGNHQLCVGRGQFQASTDETGLCGKGLELQGFARIETGGRPSWKTTLVESAALKTLEAARAAGVQRILFDLGLYEGAINGDAGAGFQQVVAGARTQLGYPADEDVMQTYVKLLAEAAKQQSQVGLTFCNRSPAPLWVALGQVEGERRLSRGWWRIQANQCEKVIKDRLTQRYFYAHATSEKASSKGVWGGPHMFCTKDSVFEMDRDVECRNRGGEETGFLAIDTLERPGAVFSFGPQQSAANAPAPVAQ